MTMNTYNEYGGFLQLELGRGTTYHSEAIYLNSARNALKYIIRLYKIRKIAVPYFTCPVVWQVLKDENCDIVFYDCDLNMNPNLAKIRRDDFFIVNDYFGVMSEKIDEIISYYPNVIIDNAQAFFSYNCGLAAFYSPRKFFGLPDGGLVITSDRLNESLDVDVSYLRCLHLLKRHDLSASASYSDFCDADKRIDSLPMRYMSRMTENLMSGIDYDFIKNRRIKNYNHMHKKLSDVNLLNVTLSVNATPMAYPLLIENKNIKNRLIQKKIYVATYWPNLEDVAPADSNTLYLRDYILPLPIDQRYDIKDIDAMLKIIESVI
ncbi:hypothetical protein SOASR015_34970 [Pectobacterium carotovorum subsp. carotovorum]|nr:hypothetical protein SOASR015_34970 [Pectobacterium carotovorum subsp. carotovorum]GLX58380.1 hypothetical protein Pcaca02_36890 [Pectobacterium carotovorum subsp. carotovorum]